MNNGLKQKTLSILAGASDMTLATVREDGYPQATTVSYVNDDLTIYFGCAAGSQKAVNIARNYRVSLTVNLPYSSWEEIRGVSIGGRADRVTDPREMDRVGELMLRKFPQIAQYASTENARHNCVPN
jgi:general stress protein 26